MSGEVVADHWREKGIHVNEGSTYICVAIFTISVVIFEILKMKK